METNRQETIPQGYKATALGVIPQEWEIMSLSKAFRVQSGYAFKSERFTTECGIPVIRISNLPIDNKYVDLSDCVYYPPSENIKQQFIVHQKDLLIAMSGATTGKTAIYNYFSNAFLNQRVGVFRQISDQICCQYLQAIVESHLFMTRLQPLLIAGAQPNISPGDIESMIFPVPPLGEQRKIAEVLGVWDLAIAKQVQLVERLTERKRALMQRLLTAKLRLPGFSAPWKKVHYSDILKEVRRTLTWDEHELYDLISVRRRSGGVFHRESLYGHEIKTKTLRPALEGDFLISKMQIVHGASGVVPKHLSGMKISGSYIALIAKDPKKLNINYFNLWSQMPLFYHQTFVSSYGVHIEKMTFDLDAFMSLSMNLPPIEEQNRIVEVISTATDEIELAQAKLELYHRQKRGLMQQLLTGKKRVTY